MDWKVFVQQDPRLSGMYQRVAGRPAWPARLAVLCAGAVIAIPLILLLLAALLVGMVVYFVGSAIASILPDSAGEKPQSSRPADDLRENVRVIRPEP